MKKTVLVAVATSLLLGATQAPAPVHAEEEEAGAAYWRLGGRGFEMRENPQTGEQEEDKNKVETGGGVTTYNTNNLEVKCVAERGDGAPPAFASGRAVMHQKFVWEEGTDNRSPTAFFKVDITTGVECHASPLIDGTVSDPNQRPGPANAKGVFGEVSNSSIPTMDFQEERNQYNVVIPTGRNNTVLKLFVQSAEASASSLSETSSSGGPTADGDGPPPPPPTTRYVNKACKAEGRTYGKTGAPKPYPGPVW